MNIRATVKVVIANLYAFSVMYFLFTFVYFAVYGYIPWGYLWLIPLPFLFLLARKKIKRRPIFLILHILAVIPPFFLIADTGRMWIVFVFLSVVSIFSINSRFRGQEKSLEMHSSIFSLALYIVAFIVLQTYEVDTVEMSSFLVSSFLLNIMLIVLFIQMDNLDFSANILREQYKRPIGSVIKMNNRLILAFLGFLSLMGVLAALAPVGLVISAIEAALRWLASVLLAVIGAIFYAWQWLMHLIFNPIESLEFIEEEAGGYFLFEVADFPQDVYSGDSLFEFIVAFTTISLTTLAILLSLLLLAHFIYKWLLRRSSIEFLKGMATEDMEERLARDPKGLARLFPKLSPRLKNEIRRAYVKKVNYHIKRGVHILPSDTPEIIAEKIRPIEDIADLTAAYELVRYGK